MIYAQDALLVLCRFDKATDQLAMLRCSKSTEKVNQDNVNILSPLYTIQVKPILSCPTIPRSEIDDIIRDAHMNDRVEKEMLSKAMEVKGVVEPHALYAGGAQPAGGGGAASGGGGGARRGGRHNDGQQQQHSRNQHRQPTKSGGGGAGAAPEGVTAPQWRWDDSGAMPCGTGGQVPAMGWVPSDPPPEALPPMPPPPVTNLIGWGPPSTGWCAEVAQRALFPVQPTRSLYCRVCGRPRAYEMSRSLLIVLRAALRCLTLVPDVSRCVSLYL